MNFADHFVIYALVHVTALGNVFREPELSDTDHVLRLGWIAFGTSLHALGGAQAWREPIHINFTDFLWTPVPEYSSSGPQFTIRHDRVRWSLHGGATAYLHVEGV